MDMTTVGVTGFKGYVINTVILIIVVIILVSIAHKMFDEQQQ